MTITADQCVADGGLINPEAFPAKSADLDTGLITGSATDLRSMGSSVKTQVEDIDTTWSGLSNHYEAPEGQRVYELMDPAVTSAQELDTTLSDVADHLDTYASALDGIKPRLQDLERRAEDFRADVIDGVQVDASAAEDASFGDLAKGAVDWVPYVDERQVTVPWYEDGDTVARNEELLGEYAGLLEEITQAVATCANAINALVEGMCVAQVEATPAEAFTNPQQPMPWGTARDEERNCPESVGHGTANFGKGVYEDFTVGFLGHDQETGKWFQGHVYKQTWGGLVDLVGATAAVTAAGWTAMGYSATGHDWEEMPDWVTSQDMQDRSDLVASGWGTMIGYDHQAAMNGGNGWHQWSDDAWSTGTETVLNIGTSFIPGAGQAGAVVKAGSVGARASRVARIAEGVADVAVPGGSWAVRGGTRISSQLRNFISGFDEGVPTSLARGGDTPGSPYADLFDAVDDVAPEVPTRSTPVSDNVFGNGETPGSGAPEATEPAGGSASGDGTPRGTSPQAPAGGSPEAPAGGTSPEAPAGGSPEAPAGGSPEREAPADGTAPDARDGAGESPAGEQPELFDPETSPRQTVGAGQAPEPYGKADVEQARDGAPVNEQGEPVDHRTGEPLRSDGPSGERRWHMSWDPEAGEWVAQNPGAGRAEPGGLPLHGEPDSFGYDANGDRMPYANDRPKYSEQQVHDVWEDAKDENGEVWVTDRDGQRVQVEWEPGQSRDGGWDMGHIPEAQYRSLREDYLSHRITLDEFLAEYRDPDNYQVEHPGRNRSRVDEMPGTGTVPDAEAGAPDAAPRGASTDDVTETAETAGTADTGAGGSADGVGADDTVSSAADDVDPMDDPTSREPDAPQGEAPLSGSVLDSSGRDITSVIDASGLDHGELVDYLEANNPQAARELQATGQWPANEQIPHSPDVLLDNGRIDWSDVPDDGFAYVAGEQIREPYVPVEGEVIDRFGPPGRFVSPIPDSGPYPYGERALPYVEDAGQYHRYEVVGDMSDLPTLIREHPDVDLREEILAKLERYDVDVDSLMVERGPIAPGFGRPGGGVQYKLPLSTEDLQDLGVLRELDEGSAG